MLWIEPGKQACGGLHLRYPAFKKKKFIFIFESRVAGVQWSSQVTEPGSRSAID